MRGGGSRPLLDNVQKKDAFFLDVFPKLIQFGIDSVWEILNERLTQSMNE